jgi:hypothetical protein
LPPQKKAFYPLQQKMGAVSISAPPHDFFTEEKRGHDECDMRER